jgi:hypothetical protein
MGWSWVAGACSQGDLVGLGTCSVVFQLRLVVWKGAEWRIQSSSTDMSTVVWQSHCLFRGVQLGTGGWAGGDRVP